MSLRLISVNIERARHLDRVLPFIEQEAPDVLCLQEILESDVPSFESLLQGTALYVPMTRLKGMDTPTGIAIVSRSGAADPKVDFYRGDPDTVLEFDDTSVDTKYRTERMVFARIDTTDDMGETYRIGTTHFTWTPDGLPDDHQRKDLSVLVPLVIGAGELAFAGDFNAPRGGEIFSMLASRWKDNIPPQYETSIDISLHRSGKTRPHELRDKMVDGLFTTPGYLASDVRLVPGVSDHMAIVARIAKK